MIRCGVVLTAAAALLLAGCTGTPPVTGAPVPDTPVTAPTPSGPPEPTPCPAELLDAVTAAVAARPVGDLPSKVEVTPLPATAIRPVELAPELEGGCFMDVRAWHGADIHLQWIGVTAGSDVETVRDLVEEAGWTRLEHLPAGYDAYQGDDDAAESVSFAAADAPPPEFQLLDWAALVDATEVVLFVSSRF